MLTLAELQEKKSHYLSTQEDMYNLSKREQRPLNGEETKRWDELDRDIATVDKDIDAIRSTSDRVAKMEQAKALGRVPEARKVPAGNPTGEISINENNVDKFLPSPLNATKAPFGDTVEGRQNAFDSAMWMYARFGMPGSPRRDKALRYVNDKGLEKRTNNYIESTNADGGYLVPVEYDRNIIKIRNEFGIMRGEQRIKPMSELVQNIAVQTINAFLGFGVTAEGSGLTQTNLNYTQTQMTAQKIGGYLAWSSELAEDAFIDVANDAAFEAGRGMAYFEDNAYWNGTASSTYGNIAGALYYATNTATANLIGAASGHTTIASLDKADVIKWLSSLPAYAAREGKIYCSRSFYMQVFVNIALNGGGNNMLTFSQPLGLNFLGIPIVLTEALPSGTASQAGNAVAAYGDPNQTMVWSERRGIRFETSNQFAFTSDLITAKATSRQAMKQLNPGTSSVLGSMVFIECAAS